MEYVVNLDEYKSIGATWKDLYLDRDKVTYCDSFGFEYIPKWFEEIHRKQKCQKKIFI